MRKVVIAFVILLSLSTAAHAVPPAPTALSASTGYARVKLAWKASTGAASYNVYRGTTAGGESATPYATGIATTAYTDLSVANGSTCYYEVAAVDGTGTSTLSNESGATALAYVTTLAAAPATGGLAPVTLSWSVEVGATSYKIYRSTTSGGEGANPYASGITSTAYTDTGVAAGESYYYTFKGVTLGGGSAASNEAVATLAPAAPTGLVITSAGAKPVTLSWTADSGATAYNIYRGTTAGGESATAYAIGVSATAYTDTAVVAGGAYFYTVKAVNKSGTSGASNEAAAVVTPPAPAGLIAKTADARIKLSWSAAHGASTYNVYRGSVAGGESTTPYATLIGGTAYTDLDVANGATRYYKVAAVNSGGTSALSNESGATAITPVGTLTASTAPGGLAPVTLSWSAIVGATTYNVYRSTAPGGEGTTPYASGVIATSYTDTAVAAGGSYYYTFKGVTLGGSTAVSAEATATLTPPAPTSLTAAAATGGAAPVTLSWASAPGATSYSVYRGTAAGGESGTSISGVVTGTSYTDTSASPGGVYFYVVRAANTAGTSAASGEAKATLAPPATTLTATAGYTQVTLNWAASAGATSYNVYRGTTAGGESATPIVVSGTAYTDTGLTTGTKYYYKTSAVNSAGTSAPSNEASATPTSVPSVPTGLSATGGNTQVILNWSAAAGAASYNVYRGTSPGGESSTPIKTGAASPYTNTGLTNGTTYYYKVAAVNASGTSVQSAEASAIPAPAPAVPANLTATGGVASVILNWSASTYATSYNVYRGTTPGSESGTAYATGVAATSYVDTAVAADGSEYSYKVKAVDGAGTSGYSNEASAWPTLQAEQNPLSTLIQGSDGWLYGSTLFGGANNNGTVFKFNPQTGATSLLHTFGASASNTDGRSPYSGLLQASDGNYYGVAAYGGPANSGVVYTIDPQANYSVYAAFTGESGNGLAPWGGLTQLPSGELYGTTSSAAGSAYGTVFKVDGSGITTLFSFNKTDGWEPRSALALGPNGELYGATYQGGTGIEGSGDGGGTLIEIDPSGSPFETLHQCGFDGANIMGPLTVGANGNLYGTTENYAADGEGDVFEMSPDGLTITDLHDFTYSTTDGMNSTAGVVILPDGSIYGTTTAGGSASHGTVWRIDPSGTFSLLHSFTGSISGDPQDSDGDTPMGGLVLASDGYLYGTTFGGGPLASVSQYTPLGPLLPPVYGAGTLYRVSPTGNYSVVLPLENPVTAPTGFAITVNSPTCATLSWSAVLGAESYNILASASSSGPFVTVGSVTGTSFNDCSLTAGTTYYYQVAAVINGVQGPTSLVLSVTPSSASQGPAMLAATPGSGTVALGWSAVAGATSYTVQRSAASGGPYTSIRTVNAPIVAYTDAGLTNGSTYYYVVSAATSGGQTLNSPQADATPSAPGPANLTATAGNGVVDLSWGTVSPLTNYKVKRSIYAAGPWTTVATPTSPSYADTAITNGTVYYYTVSAVSSGSETANSNTASASPALPPHAPYSLTATAGSGQVTLNWDSIGDAASYNILRSTTSGSGYSVIANIAANPSETTYMDTKVSHGTTYYYVVSAVDAGGASPNSPEAGASP